MIEGVILFSQMKVRDIMLPKKQMTSVDEETPLNKVINIVTQSGHSRFPVTDNKGEVVGILHAKDLLRFQAEDKADFDLMDIVRQATFVPESKRLDILLSEFRANRNHMAMVVDEYGGVAGLITIEDVLEQIVGDIEDEYDFDESGDNILKEESGAWRVKAQTEIADFNEAFGTEFSNEDYDTVGGLVIARFGRLPKRGEAMTIAQLRFQVLRADSRRLHVVQVQRMPGRD